ncbi:MAG TPA: ABC transporter ATP-binding protein [Terriglobia bacterium]|nr:ABC transporter ATP-binding protein [Terriglobia bacterium]
MGNYAIEIEDLGKQYKLGQFQKYKALRDTIAGAFSAPFRAASSLLGGSSRQKQADRMFWALKDVSLRIRHGEVIGLIGRNGAGKSTLLKVLSRIVEPTNGHARIEGRVGSLLEVGVGFHPELSGRENIFLNGAILGMKREEIAGRLDMILDFAEVGKFLDTPVKFYSSGMYVRLAFSVAAHLEPDILLVDEVLAVGDASFQKKCLGRMEDVAHGGRTVIFVSHNMATIQSLCSRAILLDGGTVAYDGAVNETITKYLDLVHSDAVLPLDSRTDREGNGALQFRKFYAISKSRGITDTICTGEDVTFVVEYTSAAAGPLRNVSVSVPLWNHMGHHMFMCWTRMTGQDSAEIHPNGEFRAHIKRFPLMPGRYTLNLWSEVNGQIADWIRNAAYINVIEGDFFGTGYLAPSSHGGMVVDHYWEFVHHND